MSRPSSSLRRVVALEIERELMSIDDRVIGDQSSREVDVVVSVARFDVFHMLGEESSVVSLSYHEESNGGVSIWICRVQDKSDLIYDASDERQLFLVHYAVLAL